MEASQERSTFGRGDTTTYFDSVVLLTMFLLAGAWQAVQSRKVSAHITDLVLNQDGSWKRSARAEPQTQSPPWESCALRPRS